MKRLIAAVAVTVLVSVAGVEPAFARFGPGDKQCKGADKNPPCPNQPPGDRTGFSR